MCHSPLITTKAGIRYTKAGSTCKVSRTGRTIASKRLLNAASMPIGTPRPTATITETPTTLNVTIAESQNPFMPMNKTATPLNSPSHRPTSMNPNIDAEATTKGQGSQSRNVSMPASPASMTSDMGLKNQAKASPIHSKKTSIGSCMGSSQFRGQSPNSVGAFVVASEKARMYAATAMTAYRMP